ncbi:MAG: excinuclease ABC subunit UvrA [Bacteroidota bacterium]|nr:excinuclease ABC subunit UvrA [Candidatus Kapabacteria bacterium]MDW8074388.1 excinuclease ABC subunit UvrA [Bacteroidota bacterium]
MITDQLVLLEPLETIRIVGAREHNLKNVALELPRNQLIVITGVSGSGKSSLAFDTLYAEGQRRYVMCLSPYARQFLGVLRKPDVDSIEGISPAISIDQKTSSFTPRSTVGTVTEIYDYLRLLYAKVGTQYCPDCGVAVEQTSADEIFAQIMQLVSGTLVEILAPLVVGRKGHYRELFASLLRAGFTRVRIDGQIQELHEGMMVDRYKVHTIELVVDRVVVGPTIERRLRESIELALRMGQGRVLVVMEGGKKERTFSSVLACPSCGRGFEPLAPNSFSFNSPYGWCPGCEGMGVRDDFLMERIIPDPGRTIEEGGIALLGQRRRTLLWEQVAAFCKRERIPLDVPISALPPDKLQELLEGPSRPHRLTVEFESKDGHFAIEQEYHGILPVIRHQFATTTSPKVRSWIASFMGTKVCDQCNGERLRPESRMVRVGGYRLPEIVQWDILELQVWIEQLQHQLTPQQQRIAEPIVAEIRRRLEFLVNVGLEYLILDRPARTLSGGESQRIRLASQLGSQLVGVLYVLDEPSVGLHPHDNHALLESLKNLRDMGNTVVVVEHDRDTMQAADVLVDLGPRAGVHGGEVLFVESPKKLRQLPAHVRKQSLTAQYLLGERTIAVPANRRHGSGAWLVVEGASGNNLREVTLRIPLGTFVCVTGVSGSGKSSLILDTLYPLLSNALHKTSLPVLPYRSVHGIEHLDKVIEIDQSPIGRTPRSNPATYTGVFTLIRQHFALLPEARIRGYTQGRFSFNVPGGRCEACEGAGVRTIEMNFLPEVYVVCDECGGKRYNPETLNVTYRGKSIADVLAMTVEEALEFFADIPQIRRKLSLLNEVGLGYITLGQQAPTLSGGEAQRLKLATELARVSTGRTLYLLDEPTTGLHFEDIRILLELLQRLVDRGNTVVVIEHNLDVIKCADWVIDLGPGAGRHGGTIVAEGTPEQIAANPQSRTGVYLQRELLPPQRPYRKSRTTAKNSLAA